MAKQPTSFRISPATKRRLHALAQASGVSVTDLVNQAIREALERRGKGTVTRFHLNDSVVWNDNRFPAGMVDDMKEKFGEGPFQVVQVRLHTTAAHVSSPAAHPEAVTIQLPNQIRQEFSGDWFKKV